MKKHLVFYTCSLINLLLLACHSDVPPSCNVSKPLEELSWLKAIIDDTTSRLNQNIRIDQATYKGRPVYRVENMIAADAGVTTLYDCQGNVLCKGYTSIAGFRSDCQNVLDEAKTGTLLYQR